MSGLLLDFGGVVLESPFRLLDAWEQRLDLPARAVRRRGPFDPSGDPEWQAMQQGTITEPQYWAGLAADAGRAVDEEWTPVEFLAALTNGPEEDFIRPEAAAIVADARQAKIVTGILSNELELLHGRAWMDEVSILSAVDLLIDGSRTGILKPDPASYQMAVDQMRADPPEVVFIDDQPRNVDGARDVGLIALHLDVRNPTRAFNEARDILGLPSPIPTTKP